MKKGFTLVELLVVIAIIGTLAATVLIGIGGTTESAKAKTTVEQMRNIRDAVLYYIVDTGQLPPSCRLNCTEETDPMVTNVESLPGWKGPYLEHGISKLTHPWSGHIGIYRGDVDGNGKNEIWVVLDDDKPGTTWADNSGKIPSEAIEKIDKLIDDGDPHSGRMFLGDGTGPFPTGEAAWRVPGTEI